jgi:DNA-binding CsgD family transcriptional regulator
VTRDPLHGYDLEQIRLMALAVVMAHPSWWTEGTRDDHFEAARFGIVEALMLADVRPARAELQKSAQKALRAWVHAESQYRGRRIPGVFAGYWEKPSPSGPEDIATDRLAGEQILAVLSPRQRDAIEALAKHGNFAQAAASMGVTAGTFKSHIARARVKFTELWHEGLEPPGRWRRDTRATGPNEWNASREALCGTEAAYWRHKRRHEDIDEACATTGREQHLERMREYQRRVAARSD